jgi:kynurenine/2-aminoadipate aminotransferase
MVLRLFLAPGDALLCEEYTYPHIAESFVLPAGLTAVPVACDGHGLEPAALDAALRAQAAAGRPAKLIYTVPVGQNPTGAVAPRARREAVYAVARSHGALILEDDPYHLLQFGPDPGPDADDAARSAAAADHARPRGLAGLGASYLSLDVDGRVIRLDSFAKALAPGLRLGWATAAPPVIAKLVAHLHGVSLGAAPLAQVLAAELLTAWGPAGFEAHVRGVQAEYGRRAAVLHGAARRWLGGGGEGEGADADASRRPLATWSRPLAGMFMWLRLEGVPDAGAIMGRLADEAVVVVPGAYAHCSGVRARPCPHVRVSFAGASDADMEAGMARLAAVLEEVRSGGGGGGGGPAAAVAAVKKRVSPANGADTPDRGGSAGAP